MTQTTQRIPDFIGIGAAKCGTTWLSEVLRAHPQIYLPPQKELNFFASEAKFSLGIETYLKNFEPAKPNQVVGEISVMYMPESQKCAERIHNLNPNVKIIVCLRDPVDRAISHYKWLKQLYNIGESFEELLYKDSDLITHGLYHHNLRPFLDLFPREQFHFIKFTDINNAPAEVIKNTCAFLGVDTNFQTNLIDKKIGATYQPRFRFLENLRQYIFKAARNNGMSWLIGFSKKSGLSALFRKINNKSSSDKSQFSQYMEKARSFFEEDAKNLNKLIKH